MKTAIVLARLLEHEKAQSCLRNFLIAYLLLTLSVFILFYLQTFKAQIEKQDQYNGPILVAPDVKLIFGTIPAIYKIHCAMRDELTEMVENWNEEQLVGTVISKNVISSTVFNLHILRTNILTALKSDSTFNAVMELSIYRFEQVNCQVRKCLRCINTYHFCKGKNFMTFCLLLWMT